MLGSRQDGGCRLHVSLPRRHRHLRGLCSLADAACMSVGRLRPFGSSSRAGRVRPATTCRWHEIHGFHRQVNRDAGDFFLGKQFLPKECYSYSLAAFRSSCFFPVFFFYVLVRDKGEGFSLFPDPVAAVLQMREHAQNSLKVGFQGIDIYVFLDCF